MIALTDRQRAVLRAALEACSGRDLTPTEQRELGEALAGHLELASAWGRECARHVAYLDGMLQAERDACIAVERHARSERDGLRAGLADAERRIEEWRAALASANALADEWAARCRAATESRDAAVARVAELERELAALRQPAPAEPARVPVAVGQVRRDPATGLLWRVDGVTQALPELPHEARLVRMAPPFREPEVDEPAQGDERDPAADPQIGDAWVRGGERRVVEAVKRVYDGHEVRVVLSGGVTPTPISVWLRAGWAPAQGDGGAR